MACSHGPMSCSRSDFTAAAMLDLCMSACGFSTDAAQSPPFLFLPSGCNYTSRLAMYCMLLGGTSVADMAIIAGCPLPNDHHVHDSRHYSGWLWCAAPPFGTSPHCCPSITAGAELSTEVSSCIRMRAVSSLMLATFYLVDGCARLRTDRLHRRERKNSWSARLQAWLARVRAITLSHCCHVPQRRTPEKPGVLTYEWQDDKRRCSYLLRHVRGTCRPTPPAICAPHMQIDCERPIL